MSRKDRLAGKKGGDDDGEDDGGKSNKKEVCSQIKVRPRQDQWCWERRLTLSQVRHILCEKQSKILEALREIQARQDALNTGVLFRAPLRRATPRRTAPSSSRRSSETLRCSIVRTSRRKAASWGGRAAKSSTASLRRRHSS